MIELINKWADYYNIPRHLLRGIIYRESSYIHMYPHDGSSSRGLGQHIKGTWEHYAPLVDKSLAPLDMRFNPDASIRVAAYMLSDYLNKYHSIDKAIYSYNQGSVPSSGMVNRHGANYVRQVKSSGEFNGRD